MRSETGETSGTGRTGEAARTEDGGATRPGPDDGRDRALRSGRLGTPGLLLSVLAASAPLMVVAGVMPTAFAEMGVVGQPLLFLTLGAVLVLFCVGYAEMSRHVHHAGALYAYIARGLGPTAGAGASWVALVAYSALQAGIYGLFGFEVSGLLDTHLHVVIDWWVPALLAVALAGGLAWLRIDLNAKVLGVLLAAEVVLVTVFDAAAVAHPAADRLSLHAFNPHALSRGSVGVALCFCLAAFTGFEQAPVYAEETRRPRVVVRRVMFLAVGSMALFFAFSSWALTLAAGPRDIVDSAQKQGPGLLFALADKNLGGTFAEVLHVLFVTGMFAALLSFHNVVARYAFAMGREALLPAGFGRTNADTGAPAAGSLLQTAVSVAVVALFAVTDHGQAGDPTAPVTHLFTWMAGVGALGVVLLMAAVSLAVIVFFVRRGAVRAQAWRLLAAGASGTALLGIAAYTVRQFPALVGAGPDATLSRLLPGIVAVALGVGLARGLVLRARRRAAPADEVPPPRRGSAGEL
ncbi:APC family permease [Streptomyces sp. NBC_00083]|uniref:APC family permease n=1 Tax=Streptomyces sp. NBC_00083 TaxID=2975647 RepID=UPI00225BE027|nr:APC family permease [Streptomyces sp. NBC_00083]MCX5383382.1 APC family permease [Streptomyces sp. NBC_00083]